MVMKTWYVLEMLTKTNNIAEYTQDTKVKVTILECLATTKDERNRDGACVADYQENYTDSRESVKGSRGTEID